MADDIDTQPSNDNDLGALSIDGAADAFLKTLETDDPESGPSDADGGEQPPSDDGTNEGGPEDAPDQDGQDDADLDEGEPGPSDDGDEDGDDADRPVDLDGAVEFKANGTTVRVPVRDLTRLYGMEASLTQRSQDLIRTAREAEEAGARHVAALGFMVKQAEERRARFKDMDFLRLARELPEADYNTLKREAEQAESDYGKITSEIDEVFRATQERQRALLKTQAEQALPMIKAAIPEWSNDHYDKLRGWAVENGASQQVIDQLVDPFAWKVIHWAHQYHETKRIGTKKRAASPKRVLKSTERRQHKPKDDERRTKSMETLQKEMSQDAAADAFFARITEERAEI